jgi:hypothetical protein
VALRNTSSGAIANVPDNLEVIIANYYCTTKGIFGEPILMLIKKQSKESITGKSSIIFQTFQ